MKKMIIYSLLYIFSIFPVCNCEAREGDYLFGKNEKNFIKEFYGEEFLANINYNDYIWIKGLNLEKNGYEIVSPSINSSISILSSSINDANKNIVIAKSCNTKCIIITKVEWKVNPYIMSYDVIGSRLVGGTFTTSSLKTKVKYGTISKYENNNLFFQNGYGTIIKLPITNNLITIEQQIEISGRGKIFSSYQHAKTNVSLFTSKQFIISSPGYGGVFEFYGQALNQYDNMPGVYITF